VEFVERDRGQLNWRARAAAGSPLMLQSWADNFLNETGYFAELRRLEKNPENSREPRPQSEGIDGHDGSGVGNLPAERLENFLETSRSTATARRKRKTPATP
jgi:hypothetical protein